MVRGKFLIIPIFALVSIVGLAQRDSFAVDFCKVEGNGLFTVPDSDVSNPNGSGYYDASVHHCYYNDSTGLHQCSNMTGVIVPVSQYKVFADSNLRRDPASPDSAPRYIIPTCPTTPGFCPAECLPQPSIFKQTSYSAKCDDYGTISYKKNDGSSGSFDICNYRNSDKNENYYCSPYSSREMPQEAVAAIMATNNFSDLAQGGKLKSCPLGCAPACLKDDLKEYKKLNANYDNLIEDYTRKLPELDRAVFNNSLPTDENGSKYLPKKKLDEIMAKNDGSYGPAPLALALAAPPKVPEAKSAPLIPLAPDSPPTTADTTSSNPSLEVASITSWAPKNGSPTSYTINFKVGAPVTVQTKDLKGVNLQDFYKRDASGAVEKVTTTLSFTDQSGVKKVFTTSERLPTEAEKVAAAATPQTPTTDTITSANGQITDVVSIEPMTDPSGKPYYRVTTKEADGSLSSKYVGQDKNPIMSQLTGAKTLNTLTYTDSGQQHTVAAPVEGTTSAPLTNGQATITGVVGTDAQGNVSIKNSKGETIRITKDNIDTDKTNLNPDTTTYGDKTTTNTQTIVTKDGKTYIVSQNSPAGTPQGDPNDPLAQLNKDNALKEATLKGKGLDDSLANNNGRNKEWQDKAGIAVEQIDANVVASKGDLDKLDGNIQSAEKEINTAAGQYKDDPSIATAAKDLASAKQKLEEAKVMEKQVESDQDTATTRAGDISKAADQQEAQKILADVKKLKTTADTDKTKMEDKIKQADNDLKDSSAKIVDAKNNADKQENIAQKHLDKIEKVEGFAKDQGYKVRGEGSDRCSFSAKMNEGCSGTETLITGAQAMNVGTQAAASAATQVMGQQSLAKAQQTGSQADLMKAGAQTQVTTGEMQAGLGIMNAAVGMLQFLKASHHKSAGSHLYDVANKGDVSIVAPSDVKNNKWEASNLESGDGQSAKEDGYGHRANGNTSDVVGTATSKDEEQRQMLNVFKMNESGRLVSIKITQQETANPLLYYNGQKIQLHKNPSTMEYDQHSQDILDALAKKRSDGDSSKLQNITSNLGDVGDKIKTEQLAIAKEAQAGALVSLMTGMQQAVGGAFNIINGKELLKAAAQLKKAEKGTGLTPTLPMWNDGYGGPVSGPRGAMVISGNGASYAPNGSAGDATPVAAGGLPPVPLGDTPKSGDINGPTPGAMAPIGGSQGSNGNANSGFGSGGGTAAAQGEPEQNAKYASLNNSDQGYSSSPGAYSGGGGKPAGANDNMDLSALAKLLPQKEEDFGSKNGILDFGGRKPAGEDTPYSFLDPSVNIFKRVHDQLQDQQKAGAVGLL